MPCSLKLYSFFIGSPALTGTANVVLLINVKKPSEKKSCTEFLNENQNVPYFYQNNVMERVPGSMGDNSYGDRASLGIWCQWHFWNFPGNKGDNPYRP